MNAWTLVISQPSGVMTSAVLYCIIVFFPHLTLSDDDTLDFYLFLGLQFLILMQLQILKLEEWEVLFVGFKPVNHPPSTRDVSSVTLAALRLPAGRLRPIFSSFSRRHFPPFLDFALWEERNEHWGEVHTWGTYICE